MLTSSLGVAGVAVLILLALGVLNPMIAVGVVLLLALPLVLRGVLGLFKHASPPVTGEGQRIPTTREASYDPVER